MTAETLAQSIPTFKPAKADAPLTGPGIGSRWYAFRAAARQEATAEAHLARQGFSTFLPRLAVVRRHAGKSERRKVWLFPRYGFVALDLDRQRWRSVNGTLGVEGLVMGGERPMPVPPGVVEALQARADRDGTVEVGADLPPGSRVQLIDGPLAGTLATLVRLDDRGRAELLIELMAGGARVLVDRDHLVAATPNAG